MTVPILHAGLLFMGTTTAGNTVRLWSASREGHWHAAYDGGEHPATTEPVPADAIPALLAVWGVEATSWISWATVRRAKRPDPRPAFEPPG